MTIRLQYRTTKKYLNTTINIVKMCNDFIDETPLDALNHFIDCKEEILRSHRGQYVAIMPRKNLIYADTIRKLLDREEVKGCSSPLTIRYVQENEFYLYLDETIF